MCKVAKRYIRCVIGQNPIGPLCIDPLSDQCVVRPYDDSDEEVEGEECPDDDEEDIVEVVVDLEQPDFCIVLSDPSAKKSSMIIMMKFTWFSLSG